jgi:multimeric flavodoxin WrbA
MKALVSFYSRTGTMEKLSTMVSENLRKAGVETEISQIKRKAEGSYMYYGFEAVTGKKPEIVGGPVDLLAYDVIFVGFPIWAGRPAAPVKTFLEDGVTNAKGKKFVTLAVSASKVHAASGLPIAEAMVNALGGTVVASMPFCQRSVDENMEKAAQVVESTLAAI